MIKDFLKCQISFLKDEDSNKTVDEHFHHNDEINSLKTELRVLNHKLNLAAGKSGFKKSSTFQYSYSKKKIHLQAFKQKVVSI